MARLPYISDAEATDQPGLRQLYHEIAGLRGSVHNLHRILANQPEALRAFMVMSRYVRNDAALDPRLRELAVLATAYALDVEYEKHHHLPAARRVGISEEQLAAFPNWQDASVFNAVERAVLTYADQVARRRQVDDVVFAALEQHLSTSEILDLALTVGWYHLCAVVIMPLGIEVD
ncbi:MAG TPA: carboxymuconolactone decarboxylase family protein [Chloroflexota bacterium]|nr:carboxymuconolactone decarboxylase family protein [Chloroflexota bacterium]